MIHRTFGWMVLTAALVSTGAVCGHASDVVEIRLNGHYYTEPATIRLNVAVEPAAENRVLRVEADGDQMFVASHVTLSGKNEKRFHYLEFKNLLAGRYILRAGVMSNTEFRGVATRELVVVGVGRR